MTDSSASYRSILQQRSDLYNAALESGRYRPFVLPYDILPDNLILIGVLFGPQLSPFFNKLLCWFLTGLQIVIFARRWNELRITGLGAGYIVGFVAAQTMYTLIVFLHIHDPAKDFKRIVRQDTAKISHDHYADSHNDTSNENGKSSGLRYTARKANGQTFSLHQKEGSSPLVWQSYPWHSLKVRYAWASDLLSSCRGVHWNWQIRLTGRKRAVQINDMARIPLASRNDKRSFARHVFIRLIIICFLVDLLKTCLMTEPFFLGIAALDSPTPWAWLAWLDEYIPYSVKLIRMLISLIAILLYIEYVLALKAPIGGVVVPLLFGQADGAPPSSEPWMYPADTGSLFGCVGERGLAGLWGDYWHQKLRYRISEPAKWLIHKLKIKPKGTPAAIIFAAVAFMGSAILHSAGLSTTFSIVPVSRWSHFVFFCCQGAGVIIQASCAAFLNAKFKFSKAVRRFGNILVVTVFLICTSQAALQDGAYGGLLLMEPLPISIFRGLGFGPADGWFPWSNLPEGAKFFGFWDKGPWYQRGLAIY